LVTRSTARTSSSKPGLPLVSARYYPASWADPHVGPSHRRRCGSNPQKTAVRYGDFHSNSTDKGGMNLFERSRCRVSSISNVIKLIRRVIVGFKKQISRSERVLGLLVDSPLEIQWVQSVSLQRGDLPNSRSAWVIWRVPSGAFSTLEPVVGHYWPALGMKRTGAYPCRTAVRRTDAARSMLHGWST
jgi:hypothetical protein